MSKVPVPQLGLGFIPDFPHDFDSDQEVEFIPEEQPAEAPVLPDDQLLDMPADHEPALADPLPVHDPIPDDVPVVAPPAVDAPVVAPPVVDAPVVAPLPDPMPVFVDHAPFATHIDPRYADTRNWWIEDDDDYPPFVLPVTPPAAPVFAPADVPQYHPHVSDVHRTDLPITFL
ncbi:36.4 kDa proline-rich protein-like [Helianthus annuus]|uniref:36.4 kDa proline-rich protein-like n=1 Tax=Helianthus annuus TaxID=4232 RepID=UPI000B90928A|nr:36.4 kDa proline-rich protein-like [Helianthus annuus]